MMDDYVDDDEPSTLVKARVIGKLRKELAKLRAEKARNVALDNVSSFSKSCTL